MSRRGRRIDPSIADVEIGAAARADRVRFNRKPEVEVEFESAGGSGSESERENLPDEIEPGKTYRDVRVAWRGWASLVRERLQDVEARGAARRADRGQDAGDRGQDQ